MTKPELKTKLVSLAFIALMLCSIFAGAVSAENASENPSDNTFLNETSRYVNSDTSDSSDNYSLSSKIDSFVNANKPLLLFFYADWCYFCEEQKPVIDELEQGYADKIAFIRVNAEENPQTMNEFGVTGFPAMFLIVDENEEGYVYQEFSGFTEKDVLKESFDYVVGNGKLPEGFGSSSFYSDQVEMSNLSIISRENLTLAEFDAELANDIEFKELHDYAAELGYVYPSLITKTVYDNGVTITNTMMISDDNKIIFLTKVCSDSTKENASSLIRFDNTGITIFNKDGGTTINTDGVISSCGTHHSCSFWTCYQNCLYDTFFEKPTPSAQEKVKNFFDQEQKLLDFLTDCAGADAAKGFEDAYDAAKLGKCSADCDIMHERGYDPDDVRKCIKCATSGAVGTIGKFIPEGPKKRLAKCAINLMNHVGEVLEKYADCAAECADPRTASKNWGHPCRDFRSPEMWRCVGPAKGQYGCKDCEWKLEQIVPCPPFKACAMTPSGPVCKDPCKDVNCNDGDWCTIDWCVDGSCRHARKPGCDEPDDNFDVSTYFLQSAPVSENYDIYEPPGIGVLSNSYSPFFSKLLAQMDESSDLIDLSLQGIENYPVFIITSGGLYGLDSLPTFKSRLEQYVDNGGTLIVFTQQHGYEFDAVPGDLGGYGWLEDQSCHYASVGISTYHPIFARQSSEILDVNVDGFFTKWPANSTILLSRTKNGMPAMVMYEYGAGTVLATTLYSDMASGLYQQASDEMILIKDMITWAKSANAISTYGPGIVNISINVTNPHYGPLEYPVPEFDLVGGEAVNMSVNVTNYGNITSDKVSFVLFDPYFNNFSVNVSETISVNQSKIVNLTYETTNTSKSGIWSIIYLLFSDNDTVAAGWGGEFALNYNITNRSQYEAFVTVFDPDKNIVKEEANKSLFILPGNTGNINFTLDAQKHGIWPARYSVLSEEGNVLVSDTYYFAVSNFKENPEGFTYQDSELTFSVTSDAEEYAYGSNATFTIHVWNHGNVDKSVTCWWSFPHHYWETKNPIYGTPGTIQPGHNSNLNKQLNVPAHSEASFMYIIPVNAHEDRLWANFYEGDETSSNYLGGASRGFYGFYPSIDIQIETDKQEYVKGADVSVLLNLTNRQNVSHNITITVRTLDLTDSFNINLNASASENKTLYFTPPAGSRCGGVYMVTAEVYEDGNRIGSTSTYFEVLKDYSIEIGLDKPDKIYGTRQNMTVYMNTTNFGASHWNFIMNLSILSLGFNDTRSMTVNPNETESISYHFSIPQNITAGKHDVITSFDNSTVRNAFFIPNSNLVLSYERISYSAGENWSINLTNIGGVDTQCNCSIKFYDPRAFILYENDTNQESVLAGETKTFTFEIPEQAVSGGYYLLASCKDLNTGKIIRLSKWYDISGLKASLTSNTDNKVYFKDENISILTNITNLDGAIVNGTLNLKIGYPYIPEENGEEEEACCFEDGSCMDMLPDDCIAAGGAPKGPDSVCLGDMNENGIDDACEEGVLTTYNIPITPTTKPQRRGGTEEGTEDCNVLNLRVSASPRLNHWWKMMQVSGKLLFLSSQVGPMGAGIDYDYNDSHYELHRLLALMSINESKDIVPHRPAEEINGISQSNFNVGFRDLNSQSMEIKNETVWKDETRILNENLTINSTGNLTLINTTLIVNCSSDGQYHIEVQSGGEMHILDGSNITSMNTGYEYYFMVMSGAIFEMRNSELHECGYLWRTNGERAGLWINTNDTVIENNSITNNFYGIILHQSNNNTLTDNTVNSNKGGIRLTSSNNNNISNNNVSLNSDGIYLDFMSNNNNISNNNVCSNSYKGITLGYSSNNNLGNNNASSNSIGIYLGYSSDNNNITNNNVNSNRDYGIYLHYSSNNITSNNANSNYLYGICLDHSGNSTIVNNNAHSNAGGIFLYYSSNNTITSNSVSSNGLGIHLRPYSSINNLIYNNYFDNTGNAYVLGNNIWNITKIPGPNIVGGPWLGGNYWSDYAGNDTDGDGLGDTLLPYNDSGYIKNGGDYLPLIKPKTPTIIWETNITINMAENEIKNILTDVPADALKDVTGKIELITTLYSDTGQIIAYEDPFFYITDTDTSLTMETDKRVYKPNETINIYGDVKNHGNNAESCNLSIKKDGDEIFSDAFTLNPDETHEFVTNTSSNTSFTLEGTVDGVTVTDFVSVESPSIKVSVIAPDVVGISPFNVGVLIENTGGISADLNVKLNSTWNVTIPEGESRLLETTMSVTENRTLNVTISGDVNETIQKEVICGENARINITPEPTYLEGMVEIPFTIENTGILDSEFNATFFISSDEQDISKSFFVPKNENITDSVSFNLTKGAHLLRYVSPFEVVNTTINVLSPPDFVVTSIYPEEMNFTIGENVSLTFIVKNIGGSEGEATLKLSIPDFEDTNRTWVRAGAEENISFSFTIPDDLEKKSYKGFYELDGERDEFTFFVQGAKISVNASRDKNMYEDGDTAILTLDITNECSIDLNLYSRVKFNEYDSVQNFTLPDSGSKILIFDVPLNFIGDNKMLYTVYMDTGRALYINSMYVYEKKPDVPMRLYTDKDVYNIGEVVTIYIIDVTKTDVLNLTAPNFTYNNTISGPTTLEFTLPELRSGTYYIDYTFGNFSSAHLFDVIGYSARILEASLDTEEYISGDKFKLAMNVESNRNVSGLLKMLIYDAENELIDEFEMNETLKEGENKIEISRALLTNTTGIHVIVYGFYADLSGHSLTSLVSGAEYFDAYSLDTEPPVISNVQTTDITAESAAIKWDTDEASDSLAEYGTESESYTEQKYDSVRISSHSITLTGLSAETTYYYVVNSTDANGNSNESSEYTFTTLLAPDTTPPASVSDLNETDMGTTWILWNWTNPADSDFNHTEVWIEGEFKENVTTPEDSYNATGLGQDTTYEIGTRTIDNSGNVNQTWVNDTATTLLVPDTTPPASVSDLDEIDNGTTWILWNWTNPSDSDFNHTEVWIEGEFKENVTTPEHSYNATGLDQDTTYEIRTSTVDNSGNVNQTEVKDTAKTLPTLNQPPVSDPNGPYTDTEGFVITFDGSGSYDSDGTIVSYDWDFGDGNASTVMNPLHAYAQDGTYSVTLNVTDDNGATGTNTTTATVVDTEPGVIFMGTPTSGPEPLTVKFTDASTTYDGIVTWEWDFGDGNTNTEQNSTHEYASEGTYTVSLTVYEVDGDSDTETKEDYITVTAEAPIVSYGGSVYGKKNVWLTWGALGEPDNRGALLSRNARIEIELDETIPECKNVSVWVRKVGFRLPSFEVDVSSDGSTWTQIGSGTCNSFRWTRFDFTTGGAGDNVKYIGIRNPGGRWRLKLMGLDAVRAEGC